MKVDTYLFGTVEVDDAKVISFPKGLVGFENSRRFMLAHEEETPDGPVSFTLQSLDEPAVAFQIIDPTSIGFNYDLVLTDEEESLLQSPAADDVAVMQMLYKSEGDGKEILPSFRAPLLINTKARVGLQKVMEVMTRNITLSNLVSKV